MIGKIKFVSIIILILLLPVSIFKCTSNNIKYVDRLKKIQSGEENLNIILISIDTLRADHLSPYGYDIDTPTIQKFADEGTTFMDARTPVPLTLPAHCSMLTGNYPAVLGIHDNYNYFQDKGNITISEILQDNNYKTSAFISATPLDDMFGFNQGFDNFNDDNISTIATEMGSFNIIAEEITDRAINWIKKNSGNKFFTFIHYYDPHSPYSPPEPYDEKYNDFPYDGEIAYVDNELGRLFDELNKDDILKNTLVIITSDHGEAFGEHNEYEHGIFIYKPTLHIPLIFWAPGLIPGGKKHNGLVSLIDIVPTIIEILNIKVKHKFDGRSLVPSIFYNKKIKSFEHFCESYFSYNAYGFSKLIGIETDNWKYIHSPEPELYNLDKDAEEIDNVFSKYPDIVSNLDRKLESLIQSFKERKINNEKKADIDDETKEALFSMGYITSGGETTKYLDISPKDKVDYITYCWDIMKKFSNEPRNVNESDFIKIVEMEPNNHNSYYYLARYYLKTGDNNKAVNALKKSIEIAPDENKLKIALAKIYIKEKQYNNARYTLESILSSGVKADIRNIKFTLLELGKLYTFIYEDYEQAINYLEEVIEIDKDSEEACFLITIIYARRLNDYEKAEVYANKYLNSFADNKHSEKIRNLLKEIQYLKTH